MTSYSLEESAILPVQLGIIALSSVVSVAAFIMLWRARQRSLQRHFVQQVEDAANLGLQLHHRSPPESVMATMTVDGVDVAIQPERIAEYDSRTGRPTTRQVARVKAITRCRWSDATIMRYAPSTTAGVGVLSEVHLSTGFAYRVFARCPDEIEAWLHPATQEAIVGLGVDSISVQSGVVSLYFNEPQLTVEQMAHAGGLAASIVHGRPSSSWRAAPGSEPYRGFGILGFPIFFGIPLAVHLPWIPGVAEGFSPIACAGRTLELTWRNLGVCVARRGSAWESAPGVPLAMMVVMSLALVLTVSAATWPSVWHRSVATSKRKLLLGRDNQSVGAMIFVSVVFGGLTALLSLRFHAD